MGIKIAFGLLAFSLFACSRNAQTNKSKPTTDTIIGSKAITDELAASSYRHRAVGYFVITGKDTSDFNCIFSELKRGGKVFIDLNIPYVNNTVSHEHRVRELKLILPIASKDFNLDSLHYIKFGRLIESGDLAIEITKEYKQENPTFRNAFVDYRPFQKFLLSSKLGRDVNRFSSTPHCCNCG